MSGSTSQGSPEKQNPQDIYIDMYRFICLSKRFVIGIGSCSYEGREVPRPAGCKQETDAPAPETASTLYLVLFGPSVDCVREAIFSPQSTDSMLPSSRNTLTDTLRSNGSPVIWASRSSRFYRQHEPSQRGLLLLPSAHFPSWLRSEPLSVQT